MCRTNLVVLWLLLLLPALLTAAEQRRIALSFDDAPLADGALLSGVERTDRVDNYDWYLAARVERAGKAGLAIDHEALRRLNVDMLVACAEFYDAIAQQALGRSPAHVLLLHENDIAALYVADLVAALRERGWQIIGVDEAYADPIATVQPATLFNNQGRVAAIAEVAGRTRRELVHESEYQAWIDAELTRRAVFSDLSGSQ